MRLDLAANARSFGASTWNVCSGDELRAALDDSREHDGVSVIVAEVDPNPRLPDVEAWWDISAAEVSRDVVTKRRRQEYERARRHQRRHF